MDAKLEGINIVAKFKGEESFGTSKPAPRIVKARIYLGINHFVNSKSPVVAEQEVDANFSGDGELTVSIDAIKYRTGYKENYRDNAFYRVALELENIPDYYLFSETKEITGIPEEFDDIFESIFKEL